MINELLSDCVKMKKELRNISRLLLTKKLSQHLMKDCRIGYSFLEALGTIRSTCLIEIGSGTGFLTRFISRVTKQVIAVEFDLRLIPYLRNYLRDLPNVHIVVGDGKNLINSCRCDTLVSNTPYHISTPLLINFVKSNLKHAVLMLQKEITDRLMSSPGSREYSRITAFVNTFVTVNRVRDFPSSSFIPEPKVNSSLVVLARKRAWDCSWLLYEDMLRHIFTQRRKLAKKVFRNYLRKLKTTVSEERLDFLGSKRVFELSIEDLLNLHKVVSEELNHTNKFRNC